VKISKPFPKEEKYTLVWIDFALACGYINKETHTKLTQNSIKIGRFMGFMIRNPERFRKSL